MCVDYDFFLRAMKFGSAAWLPTPTVLYFRNPASFFRQKGPREYLRTLAFVKARARRLLELPVWVKCYDLIPLCQIANQALRPKHWKR
jgi:hypothetical protein